MEQLSELFNTDQLLLTSAFSTLQIFLSLMITTVMALFVFFIYKRTYNGVLYSKDFNITLVMTALVVDSVMMGISGNIVLSLGLVGALSIVRFRTAVKDPKDTAFLFWAITIGVINGVAYYELSVIASIVIATVLVVLSATSNPVNSYLLVIRYGGAAAAQVSDALKQNFARAFLRSDSQDGEISERIVEVQLKNSDESTPLNTMRAIPGVVSCVLLSSEGEFAE